MNLSAIENVLVEVFVLSFKIGGPMLIISMVVGIVISVLQAATQIHEQTLTFVPKLILIGILLVLFGGSMMNMLEQFLKEIFRLIASSV
ncbi:MAG: flagellar biosynthetic protein FliQ [Firmicutes bacterium]|uniref:Flagellar biosynthetic protein FliQ n=1 Tax=Candidatus Scybalomonas excrementavium TaxID=2840943 RepID=A0A9D9I1B4_9FIRM|nr:flagellar biosynthetic protein FliQ [Candidatus Scybalomonas excrementavium]